MKEVSKEFSKEFSEVVSLEMKKQSISVKQLAKETNFSSTYIYELLGNKKRWNEDSIEAIAKILSITIQFNVA